MVVAVIGLRLSEGALLARAGGRMAGAGGCGRRLASEGTASASARDAVAKTAKEVAVIGLRLRECALLARAGGCRQWEFYRQGCAYAPQAQFWISQDRRAQRC